LNQQVISTRDEAEICQRQLEREIRELNERNLYLSGAVATKEKKSSDAMEKIEELEAKVKDQVAQINGLKAKLQLGEETHLQELKTKNSAIDELNTRLRLNEDTIRAELHGFREEKEKEIVGVDKREKDLRVFIRETANAARAELILAVQQERSSETEERLCHVVAANDELEKQLIELKAKLVDYSDLHKRLQEAESAKMALETELKGEKIRRARFNTPPLPQHDIAHLKAQLRTSESEISALKRELDNSKSKQESVSDIVEGWRSARDELGAVGIQLSELISRSTSFQQMQLEFDSMIEVQKVLHGTYQQFRQRTSELDLNLASDTETLVPKPDDRALGRTVPMNCESTDTSKALFSEVPESHKSGGSSRSDPGTASVDIERKVTVRSPQPDTNPSLPPSVLQEQKNRRQAGVPKSIMRISRNTATTSITKSHLQSQNRERALVSAYSRYNRPVSSAPRTEKDGGRIEHIRAKLFESKQPYDHIKPLPKLGDWLKSSFSLARGSSGQPDLKRMLSLDEFQTHYSTETKRLKLRAEATTQSSPGEDQRLGEGSEEQDGDGVGEILVPATPSVQVKDADSRISRPRKQNSKTYSKKDLAEP
jgi:hypothetical protein